MARQRMIKPAVYEDARVRRLSMPARLLYLALPLYCDDGGVHPADPVAVKVAVLPADACTLDDVAGWLSECEAQGLIRRYSAGGADWLALTEWESGQRINRRSRLRYPPPPASALPPEGNAGEPSAPDAADSVSVAPAPAVAGGASLARVPDSARGLKNQIPNTQNLPPPPPPFAAGGADEGEAAVRRQAREVGRAFLVRLGLDPDRWEVQGHQWGEVAQWLRRGVSPEDILALADERRDVLRRSTALWRYAGSILPEFAARRGQPADAPEDHWAAYASPHAKQLRGRVMAFGVTGKWSPEWGAPPPEVAAQLAARTAGAAVAS